MTTVAMSSFVAVKLGIAAIDQILSPLTARMMGVNRAWR